MFGLQSGRTALFAASVNGNLDIVKVHIDAGAPVKQAEVSTLYVSALLASIQKLFIKSTQVQTIMQKKFFLF